MSTQTGATEHRAHVVDARGLRCPAPIIRLARAARELAPGSVLTVLATDPAAALDVPAWARMRGHEVLDPATPPPDLAPFAPLADDVLVVSVRLG
ncbi:sulfurtransferase TusA family protein [Cellulomonas soli]